MRQLVKFLHTVSSCGLVGGLVVYMIVLAKTPAADAAQFAAMRATVSAICDYVVVPSLGISLVTGLLSMLVHRPYQQKRWAWLKAVLGFSMFESTFAITQSKATTAATLAAQAAAGADTARELALAVSSEWTSLLAITALSMLQIGFGIWRPALAFAKKAPIARPVQS